MSVFPVQGGANFSNDWHSPRSDGRVHLGTDLFAAVGTPLLAVEDGEARYGTDPLGGNIINLRNASGTRYYYAHLQRFEGTNRKVVQGEIIGYLGKTGNAATTAPHLHFEVHPGGGEAVNPYPILKGMDVLRPSPPAPLIVPAIQVGPSLSMLGLSVVMVGGYLAYRYLR